MVFEQVIKRKAEIMKWYEFFLNYLTQASTYKGIFTMLAAFGVVVSDGLTQAIIAVCVAVFGLVDDIIDERSKK